MPLKYNVIIKILKDLEFICIRSKWSHFRFEKHWYWLTVWFHPEYPPKTAKSMLKDISNIEWIEYIELIKKYNIKL
jgi:predicted RNA binding protein YcfA (HicA-like mRNA interferase family)